MNMFKLLLFVSYLYGRYYVVVSSPVPFADCTAIGYVGVSYPKDVGINSSTGAGSATKRAYLMVDPDEMFPCCGVIEEWNSYVEKTGTISFEIWRPTIGNEFQRVGSHSVTVAATGEITLSVQPGAQYTVYPGDYIGWYAEAEDMIAYKLGVGGEVTIVEYSDKRPSLSNMNVDWSSAITESRYTYAIRARYGVNVGPHFVNLDANIIVTPSNGIGQVIYTVIATDDDISDTTITQLIYNNTTKSSYFSFNNTNQQVTVNANLSTKVGYECLTFTVQDKCQNTDTGRLCITIYNDPPSVTCNPNTASVVESTYVTTNITTLTVNDANGDAVTCSLMGTSPSRSPFHLQQDSGVYMIYVNSDPNFRMAIVNQYGVYITCTDTKNSTSVLCGVRITPSQRPKIINLPNSVYLNTSDVKSYNFYNVNVSDPDSIKFTYSMTCVPTKCPFTISNSGLIQLTQDLLDHTIGGYKVYITVTDGYSQVTDTLTVIISGINDAPILTNLPLYSILPVPENTALGTSIYQVSAIDVNKDPLTYNLMSSPVNGNSYFSINSSSGIVSTSGNLDFETMAARTFNLTMSVTDGKLAATSTLVVQVLDVNERPYFEQSAYIIQTNESVGGTRLPNPGFNVTENDAGDSVKYSQDCGAYTGYIRIDATSGLLTFAVDYDLDVGGKPTLINCTINATDKGGLIATANLTITINEINDHRPKFMYSSYTFYAYNDSAVGLLLGNVSATDADIGTNGEFSFSTNQSSLYFDVSSSTGQVTLLERLKGVLAGTKLQFTVLATDNGYPSLTGSTSVTVIILESSRTTAATAATTSVKYKSFFKDEGNIAWFSLALITGLAVAAITAFICLRYICDWPSNFDPLNKCTTNFRKLDCCKDSGKYRNTEHQRNLLESTTKNGKLDRSKDSWPYREEEPQPGIRTQRKILKPSSPPRKPPPRPTSVQMRSSPTPPSRNMMTTPHPTSAQMRVIITEPRLIHDERNTHNLWINQWI